MKKQILMKWINLLLILAFITAAAAVLLYRYGPMEWEWLDTLSEVHEIAGLVFIGTGLLHLILNWNWIKLQYIKRRKRGKR
jgi:hypothetical protein